MTPVKPLSKIQNVSRLKGVKLLYRIGKSARVYEVFTMVYKIQNCTAYEVELYGLGGESKESNDFSGFVG